MRYNILSIEFPHGIHIFSKRIGEFMKKAGVLFFIFLIFIPTVFVSAKGGFDYLLIKGPGITGDINTTNPALTESFMAFADFSKGNIEPPADPGDGYLILRIYVVDNKAEPFDVLHYYPDKGYVYYDGIVEGSSEYDQKWYTANPSAEAPFREALAQSARLTWIPFGVLIVILAGFFIAYRGKPASKQQRE